MKNFIKNKNGFSLFIAIVIASSLLLISFLISKITTKGLEFANTGRNSQIAFFAADAGIECALYYDTVFEPSKFATSTGGSPIVCGSVSITTSGSLPGTTTLARIGGGGNANPTSVFGFTLNQGLNPIDACVVVLVNKSYSGPSLITRVYSYGYNSCDTNNKRRVERGIEVFY